MTEELKVPKRLKGQSPAHVYSEKQEKKAAGMVRGRRTPGSGSGNQKGDVRRRGLLRLECKSTRHRSFRVTDEIIKKIDEAAHGTDEIPVIQLDMIEQTNGSLRRRVYLIERHAMEDLLERLCRCSTT